MTHAVSRVRLYATDGRCHKIPRGHVVWSAYAHDRPTIRFRTIEDAHVSKEGAVLVVVSEEPGERGLVGKRAIILTELVPGIEIDSSFSEASRLN